MVSLNIATYNPELLEQAGLKCVFKNSAYILKMNGSRKGHFFPDNSLLLFEYFPELPLMLDTKSAITSLGAISFNLSAGGIIEADDSVFLKAAYHGVILHRNHSTGYIDVNGRQVLEVPYIPRQDTRAVTKEEYLDKVLSEGFVPINTNASKIQDWTFI